MQKILIAVVFALAGAICLSAQVTSATIQGVVADMSGAAIADAAVQVRNVGTGITQSAVSNAQGRFILPDLAVGDYELQASKTGFATVVHKGITLTVGAQSVIDFVLPVGQQAQTITVEGQVSQVDVSNAALSSLIDQRQMAVLPLNGRNFEQLIFLSPGVQLINTMTPNARQGWAAVFSAAGARPEGYTLLLDDESIDNFFRRGVGTITGSSLGMEAMAEFQTLTNTYGAQFGGNGAVINSVSQSGTNGFHGSVYEFLRNSALDARGFFDPSTIPFRRNQAGGSLGGPVKKDKAFFFVNYEGIWQLLAQTRIATVPDAAHRLPSFPRAQNPVTYDAIVSTLAVYPMPTYNFNPAAGTGQIPMVANQTVHENYLLGRFDYTLSSKDSFFARYFFDKQHVIDPYTGGTGTVPAQLPFWPERDEGMNQFVTLEWKRIISPSLLNTARASFSRPNTGDYVVNTNPALQFFPGAARPDALITIAGISPLGQSFFVPAVDLQNRFTEADDLIWSHQAHTTRAGVSVLRQQSNVFYPFRSGSVWTFGGLSVFQAGGNAQTMVQGTPVGPQYYTNRDYREIDVTPYIQDDWKVTSRLTLNLGLRWEFTTNPVEKHNALYTVTDYLHGAGLVNVPHPNQFNPSWGNLDPRFGFAWDVFGNHKTALRGGFAINHSPIFVAQYNPQYTAVKPWDGLTQSAPVFPTPFTAISPTLPAISPGWDWYIHSAPYLIQYNLNIQREIFEGTVFTIGYVGSHGVHLVTAQDRNPPVATVDANGVYHFGALASGRIQVNPRLNPNLGFLIMGEAGTSSRYHSLQTSLNRRLTRNVQAQVSYTFSSCMDDGGSPLGSINGGNSPTAYENPYDRSVDRGPCYFNARHVVRVNGLVNLPFHANSFVEGWQLTGILTENSGLPFSVSTGFDQVGYSSTGTPRPDYIAGCQVKVQAVNRWFNPACFSVEAPGTLGNVGRNTLIGPGLSQVDFAVVKDTRIAKISEAFRVQFRAEFFNILNHPQLGQPSAAVFAQGTNGTGLPSAQAGQITTLATNTASRQVQFGLKFLF